MGWSTPVTRTTGELITAAIWNQDVVANAKYLKGQAGLVKNEDALGLAVQLITGPGTVTATRSIVAVNTAGGATTVTLPTSWVTDGALVLVKDGGGAAGTNAITIETQGAETIDGETTASIATNYGGMLLAANGTNWLVIAIYGGAA